MIATAHKITDTAIGRFGRIDVLVNNAGLLLAKPFIDYTAGDFEALVSTILAGFFYTLERAGCGKIFREKVTGGNRDPSCSSLAPYSWRGYDKQCF